MISKKDAVVVSISDGELALVSINGVANQILDAGKYIVWTERQTVEIKFTRSDDIALDISDRFWELLSEKEKEKTMLLNINSNQRVLVLKDGVAVSLLRAGRYRYWLDVRLTVNWFDLDALVAEWTPELAAMVNEHEARVVQVKDREVALLCVDGVADRVLESGKYVIWTERRRVNVTIVSVADVLLDIDDAFWPLMSTENTSVKVVREYESVLMYIDGELNTVLEAGRYLISRYFRSVLFETVDTRERELLVTGQDVMTSDKVSIRVNLVLKFRVADVKKAILEVKDVKGALYTMLQIAARNFISSVTVDALLEARKALAEAMFETMETSAKTWGIDILRADIKDIILPGEMKAILNQVISAEKQSQANLIVRREETAATRSLANTAKMFEKNPMLLRLKELETMQAMAAGVDKLTIVSGKEKFLDLM